MKRYTFTARGHAEHSAHNGAVVTIVEKVLSGMPGLGVPITWRVRRTDTGERFNADDNELREITALKA